MNRSAQKTARRFTAYFLSCAPLTAWIACAYFALKAGSHGCETVINLLSLAIFLFAILAWVQGRGRFRAFWSGFALVGLGYLAIWGGWNWKDSPHSDELATTQCLEAVFWHFNPNYHGAPDPFSDPFGSGYSSTFPVELFSPLDSFPRIGHCLFALLFGWLGGAYVLWLFTKNEAAKAHAIATPPSANG